MSQQNERGNPLMAFPLFATLPGKKNALTQQQEIVFQVQTGMSLRDYFAAAALGHSLAYADDCTAKELAERSYALADAMIEAREGLLS